MKIKHKLWLGAAILVLFYLILFPTPDYPWHVFYGVMGACFGGAISRELLLFGNVSTTTNDDEDSE